MIMKKTIIILCLAFAVLINCYMFAQTNALPAQFGPHQWTATIKVIGEDGNPIAGADVSAQYDVPRPQGSDQPTFGDVKGVTDSNGMFIATHTDSSWNLGIFAEKPGYYATHTGWQFYFDDKRRNPAFTLMLKKIGKPIAMYAKKEEAKVPKENEPVGFDLTVGDWVAPYGAGKTADMLFTIHRQITSPQKFDADMKLTFPNAGDGIVVVPPTTDTGGFSRLVMAHSAPETGYQSTLTWSYHNFAETSEPASGYFFRVRTVLDSNGNIESALYGKIQGDVRFLVGSKAPQAGVAFNYYLNPTPNDENVEFDPSRDLLGGLSFDAQVKAP
jgi:hypothetical protein